MRRLFALLAATATLSLFVSGAEAVDPTFTLDLAAPTSAGVQDVVLKVKEPTVPLNIIAKDLPENAKVDIHLSSFTNDQGNVAKVEITADGKTGTHLLDVSVPARLLSLQLKMPDLPPGGPYTGRLIVLPKTQSGAAAFWKIALTNARELRPATLVVSPYGAIQLKAVRALFPPFKSLAGLNAPDNPIASFQLRDKNGNAPIEGVMLRADQGIKMPGSSVDPSNHITTTFNGRSANLFIPPPNADNDIPAQKQATVDLTFHDLAVGEYTIPLQFAARNSVDDPSQKLIVTLQVRSHVGWAVLVLIVAALISFIATRVITTLRQRAAFLGRVQAMRPPWLGSEPPILPVIWLRATLRQAEDLSSKYWLTGQTEIETKLTSAQGMLDVLTRVRDVRRRIDGIANPAVKRRALWRLDDITGRIPAAPLREQDVTQFKSDLDKLDGWCDQNKTEAEYWADLSPKLIRLAANVKNTPVHPDAAAVAASLLQIIEVAPPPAGLPAKVNIEEAYQRLTVLWELRNDQALTNQVLQLQKNPVVDVLAVLDNDLWSKLQASAATCTVVGPVGDDYEAYQTIFFDFKIPANAELEDSYLVHKKLTYNWTITIRDNKGNPAMAPLSVVSTQPRVGQFSPQAGTISATVAPQYKGVALPAVSQQIATPIRSSTDFSAARIVERTDIGAFLIALLVSVVSGIAAYALKPHFGSFEDYLALFTWGASLDQGKNFIQSLAAYKRT